MSIEDLGHIEEHTEGTVHTLSFYVSGIKYFASADGISMVQLKQMFINSINSYNKFNPNGNAEHWAKNKLNLN
jgi:hypothetical protein